jgi:hypothetical protein
MGKIGSLLFLFSLSAWAADPPPLVTVVVTPNPVVETESVQLRIEVVTGQSPIVFQPTFEAPDFVLVGSEPKYGGGKVQRPSGATLKKSFFEYVLSPKRPGNLFIRNIKVKVDSNEVRSSDTLVKVLPDTSPSLRPPAPQEEEESSNPAAPGYGGGNAGSPLSLPPDDIPASFNSDFTVHASISRKRAYVGQPIVIEYWLYDFGGLRQVEVQKWPTFNGFWKDDLEIATRFEFEEVYHRNRLMRRAFLGRYALFGIKPGRINLDKLVVRGQYVSNTATQGFFQMQQVRTGIHASQEIAMDILPLPKEGKPEKFSGAVGQFFLKLETDKTTVPQHNPVTFTVTIQGAGNFQAFDSIKLPLPPEFEVYESNTAARALNPIGVRAELESNKSFTITAVPRQAGKFTVAPLEWWYFDPEKETYAKGSTSSLEIVVSENAAGAQTTNTYREKDGAAAPSTSAVKPLKAGSSSGGIPEKWLLVALSLAAVLNAWLLVGWLKNRSGSILEAAFRNPLSEAKAELAAAHRAPAGKWLAHLEDSLFALGQAFLEVNPRGVTRAEFESLWREAGLPAPIFHRMSLLLNRLDQHRFSAGAEKTEKAARISLQNEAADIFREAAKIKRK